MSEIEQLREEIAKLRERVAVLEARPMAPVMPRYLGPAIGSPARDPLQPPYTVTCQGTIDSANGFVWKNPAPDAAAPAFFGAWHEVVIGGAKCTPA